MDPILPPSAQPIPHSAFRNPQSPGEADRLRETVQEFEGLFIGLLLKAMRGSAGSAGLFKEGSDTQMYREMFDQEMGRSIARTGGLGLAQLIMRDHALRRADEARRQAGESGRAREIARSLAPTPGEDSAPGSLPPAIGPGEKETSKVLPRTNRYSYK